MKNQNIGSDFDDFLADEGMLEEVTAVAVKRVIAWQIEQEMTSPLAYTGRAQEIQPSVRRTSATSHRGVAMTRRAKPIEMPILSDEAVIQIQDFLHLALDIFEDHYSQQLECFYQSIWQDSPELELGDFSS